MEGREEGKRRSEDDSTKETVTSIIKKWYHIGSVVVFHEFHKSRLLNFKPSKQFFDS